MEGTDCVYRDGERCLLHATPTTCPNCVDLLTLSDPAFPSKWSDPLEVIDRKRRITPAIKDMLAGRPSFLLCGGPSVNDLPLELLNTRGVFVLAVNNAGAHARIRPQAFVCSDPPKKFSHSIWMDSGVMKIIPSPKLTNSRRGRLRAKRDGKFYDLVQTTYACPNVWGFKRWSWMYPDHRFFATDGACWGNQDKGTKATGQEKTVCTMLLGLRLLYYLGSRRIYLLGVDFQMREGYGYSFGQERSAGAIASNNEHFRIVNRWLSEMQNNGTFAKFGLEVFNCFSRSGLRAFPYVPFVDAVKDCQGICEDVPDTAQWYEQEIECKACGRTITPTPGGDCPECGLKPTAPPVKV